MRLASAFVSLILAAEFGHTQTYFPPNVLGKTAAASDVVANQYSKFLKALREPSLLELAQRNPTVEAYRFLWLRELDRPEYSVRQEVWRYGVVL